MADLVITQVSKDVISIDNFYSDIEVADIMLELSFLVKNSKLQPPEKTGSARDSQGNMLKRNKGIYLDDVYSDRNISDILRINRKLFSVEIKDVSPYFKGIQKCNLDYTLISYYENGDFYNEHTDNSVLTALTYFYKEPKRFNGGNLYLPEYDTTLECLHNRTYLFPGLITHQVTPIRMDTEYVNKGFGRFCMSQFLTFKP